jgi:hypothetical protein
MHSLPLCYNDYVEILKTNPATKKKKRTRRLTTSRKKFQPRIYFKILKGKNFEMGSREANPSFFLETKTNHQ